MENYPSKILEETVNELSRLPGIGRKTALRLCLHMLRRNSQETELLGHALIKLVKEINYCTICHNISDHDTCEICNSTRRNERVICVVEDVRDVMALENTGQYNGLYHILGGIISPIEGIGPGDLNIVSLINRIKADDIEEIILALPATIEGDTTNYYIFKLLDTTGVTVSMLARGVAVGDELEYADEVTLGRSIRNRMPYTAKMNE